MGLVRHFEDYEMLKHYDNPKRAHITALEISGHCREPYTTAEMSLGRRYSTSASVSIRGEEALVATLRMSFSSTTLYGMKPWYSRIATVDLFYVWFPIFIVLMFLIQIMVPSNTPRPPVPFRQCVNILAIGVTMIGLLGVVIWGVAWLRRRFFPVATFANGPRAC